MNLILHTCELVALELFQKEIFSAGEDTIFPFEKFF